MKCLLAIVISILSLFLAHAQAVPHQAGDLKELGKKPKKPKPVPPEDPNAPGIVTPGPTNQLQTPLEVPHIICDVGPTINPNTLPIITSYLKKLKPGRPSMPFNEPGHCGRVACYYNQGLEWCNEDQYFMRLHSYDPLIEAAYMLSEACMYQLPADGKPGDAKKIGRFAGIAEFPLSNFSVTIKSGHPC